MAPFQFPVRSEKALPVMFMPMNAHLLLLA